MGDFFDSGGGGGGAPAVPQFSVDFRTLGTHSKTGAGAWAGVPGLASLEVIGFGGAAGTAEIDGSGLRCDTTGTGDTVSLGLNLTDLDASIQIDNGQKWAFLLEYDADPNGNSLTAQFGVGSGPCSGDTGYPRAAFMIRENSINRVKYYQGYGGAFISDAIVTVAGTTDILALGLVIDNQAGTGWYDNAGTATYPGNCDLNGNTEPIYNSLQSSARRYNGVALTSRLSLIAGGGVNLTKFTVWAVDSNLVTP